MKQSTTCDFCDCEMDLGQEFVFQVEWANFEDQTTFQEHPMLLDFVREHPDYMGEPFRLCKECRKGLEVNQCEKEEETQANDSVGITLRVLFWLGIATIAFAAVRSLLTGK